MTSEVSHKRSFFTGIKRFLAMLTALLVVLISAAGCQSVVNPTIAAIQDAGATPESVTTPSAHLAVSAPTPPPPEIPLSHYVRFDRLTAEDGLSNDEVWGIVRDNYGFMWFATLDGLNRYDGADFKVYRHDPDDPNTLSQSSFREMIVDHSGVLWFGLFTGGLNRYDHENDRFIRYEHDPDDPRSLSNDSVRALYEDQAGTIWVGTLDGLNKLDPESGQFTRYQHDPDDPDSLSHDTVFVIFEDSRGFLWVGTGNGIDHFDPNTETFVHYRNDPDDPHSLSQNVVRAIVEDRSGAIWVGTQNGLNRLNPETGQFSRYQYDPADPHSLSENYILTLYVDRADNLWVGTFGGGLNRFDRETGSFWHYRHNAADPYRLGGNVIQRIYEDPTGRLWIGTDAGVSMLDGGAKPFRHYRIIPNIPDSLSHNVVRSLYVNDAGIVWIGTAGGGLNRFDPQTEELTQYRHDPADANSLTIDRVWVVIQDHEGLVWVSAGPGKLDSLDPKTGQFTHYVHDANDPNSMSNSGINYLLEGRDDTLWIGTWGGGLNAFDRQTGRFTRYQNDPNDPRSLNHDEVVTLLEDRAGVLWVGTNQGLNQFDSDKGTFIRYPDLDQVSVTSMAEDHSGILWIGSTEGLYKFEPVNGHFVHYNQKSGLPSDWIYGLLTQDASTDGGRGYIWISTPNGLSRFDPQAEVFRNYDVSDGLQSNSFLGYSAYAKDPNGDMYFGGSDGFNAFDPAQISDDLFLPPVEITDFQLSNKPVPIGGDSILKQSIVETDELVLTHEDSIFSFEFVALNYRAPQKNRYKYKLEGFEDDWNEVGSSRRFATYTNLDSGDYVFRVIASNNDGVWNEEGASIKITIAPPWWETGWFRGGLLFLLAGLVYVGYRIQVNTVENRNRELEAQVAERTQELQEAKEDAEAAKEDAELANRAKSRFLANMSHELRTPLNAILGFSRMLSRNVGISSEQNEMLEIINRSGEHLLGMIGDVLSLSTIEAGRIELKEEAFNLTQMMKDIGQMVQPRTGAKGLQFHLELDADLHPWQRGDRGKLRQILINLLGNAVKYTQEGDIWLRVSTQPFTNNPETVKLQIEVQDTGSGIPADQTEQIFETFVRVEGEQSAEKGTGLGLSISKALVEMMGGQISLESELGQGSCFKFELPLSLVEADEVSLDELPAPEVVGLQNEGTEWRILVVDDNLENRLLLSNLLVQVGFMVREAENGQEAVEQFQVWKPHLIWMDIRMPVMDGQTATKVIRVLPDGETVKIVAITASVLAEQRQEILAAGCDDLVRKPFRDDDIFECMAAQLGIEYLYTGEAVAAQTPEIILTAEMLAELPPGLLHELDQTTLSLDREATFELIERIADESPEVAEGLWMLMQNFQTARIRTLLKKTETNYGA